MPKKSLGTVQIEEPIYVSCRDFSKNYYMDLLINHAVMYELKTTKALISEHRKPAISDLLLAGLNFGKLVNMRTSSVQHEFVSTTLTTKERYQYKIYNQPWISLDDYSIWMKEIMVALLSEWGTFLDTDLFYEAIECYHGGRENVIKKIEIKKDSRILGKQNVHLLNSTTAFKISAVKKHIFQYEQHLRLFLQHTSLLAIQWINFDNHNITFKTILNK